MIEPTDLGNVHVTRDGHVATVMIRKPPLNMMSLDLATKLADVLEELDKEVDIRAVVLSTEGKAFCAGADLSGRANESTSDERKTNPLYDQAVRLFSTELPIVAAIQGPAVGAGLGLALVADFRIASPEARFVANFTKLGFHPGFGLTYTLPRLIGHQRADVMFLTGRRVKADVALAWGLVDDVVYADVLLAAARDLAKEISDNAPLAIRATRATLRADLAEGVRAATDLEFSQQAWLMKTEDFAEGVKAVGERRPGVFNGR